MIENISPFHTFDSKKNKKNEDSPLRNTELSSTKQKYKMYIERKVTLNNILPCMICSIEKHMKKFAECDHQMICIDCYEQAVITNLQKNSLTRCMFGECNAKMTKNKDSVYSDFSLETKAKIKAVQAKLKYQKDSGEFNLKSCQRPDCTGFLEANNKCLSCSQQHCLTCNRLSHTGQCLGVSYRIPSNIDMKTCRFCLMQIEKMGGCASLVCPGCHFKICSICGQKWSISHHTCSGASIFKVPFFFLQECCSASADKEHEIEV